MAQANILLEGSHHFLGGVGPWVVHHLGPEGQELALEVGLALGVVCHDEEAVSGHVGHPH